MKATTDVRAGGVEFEDIQTDPTKLSLQASEVAAGTFQAPLSESQAKKQDAKKEIRFRAQGVLDVLARGESGELTGEEFQTTLEFAAGKYNASQGFGEGGKTFTSGEAALLAGTLLTPEIKEQNILQRATGFVPPQTGRILDTPTEIRTKMEQALGIVSPEAPQPDEGAITEVGFQNIEPGTEVDIQPSQDNLAASSALDSDKPIRGSDFSFGEFTQNVIEDLGTNISGILALPGVAKGLVTGTIPAKEALKQVVEGTINEYKELATDPLGTAFEKPVTTALNVLPFVQAGKAALAGKAAKAVDLAADTSRTAKIVSEAAKVADIGEGVSPIARNIYQGTLAISRKGNAFEKLRPSQTVSSMIKYGISGSSDDIFRATQTVTGKNGVLSNVVNDVVGQVQKPINTKSVLELLNEDSLGRFSALSGKKSAELSGRVRRLPSSTIKGEVDASALLDFERQLQSEAVNHRIAGLKGDTAAMELSQLKFEVADELGRLIDGATKEFTDLAQYKTPEIIQTLESVSPKLAQDYKNAKTVSELRNLQRDFVRMSKIIEIARNEPSGLGKRLFGVVSQIPIAGPGLEAAFSELAVPAGTNTAVRLNQISPATTAAQSALLNPNVISGARRLQTNQTR